MRSTRASIRAGSWPISIGARLSAITLQTASGAPWANASPSPTSPASVRTRTTICLRVPAVHEDGGVMGFMGMASGMVSIAVIFMYPSCSENALHVRDGEVGYQRRDQRHWIPRPRVGGLAERRGGAEQGGAG